MSGIVSILFVSESQMRIEHEAGELCRIVVSSSERNTRLGVTGGLIFAQRKFAVVLEGRGTCIEELLDRVNRDSRHANMRVVDHVSIDKSAFTGWGLIYHGGASYIGKRVESLLRCADIGPARDLREFMLAMSVAR